MREARSISVVIPTLNSASLVPGHIESLKKWIDLAEEVIVVDSFSKDDTVELLRKHLAHPRIKFLTHPPGLYESWNFGVQNARAKYVYIATVGDSITAAGLERLWETAEKFQSGVVISKPEFVEMDGKPAPDIFWPIDDLVATRQIKQPRLLDPLELVVFTVTNLDGTLLGSSASNLYRTDVLQKFPFPTEFGKGGDGAWSCLHVGDVAWAVIPEKISTMLCHPNAPSAAQQQAWKTSQRFDHLLESVLCKGGGSLPQFTELEKLGIPALLKAASRWLDHKQRFDAAREQSLPWFLNPRAWLDRSRRNRFRRECLESRKQTLTQLDSEACPRNTRNDAKKD